MIKCEKCNVNIADDAIICPLCKNVLDIMSTNRISNDKNNDRNNNQNTDESISQNTNINIIGKSNMYPTVENKLQKRKLAIKLIIFLCCIAEAVLVLINLTTEHEKLWSIITGIGLAYICFTTMYLLKSTNSHRKTIEMLTFGTLVLLILIDVFTSWHGWSIIYGVPCTLLAIELLIMILEIVDRKSWQEYILLQILLVVLTVINLVAVLILQKEKCLLSVIAVGVACASFIGILLFGRTKAINEVNRRFKL